MKIIAAVDFTPVSLNAAHTAAKLARKLGDSLLLIRVIEPPVHTYPELRVPDVAIFQQGLVDASQVPMKAAADSLAGEGVKIETRVLSGVPAQTLAEVAREERARVIVMGTHGRGAVGRFFFGSVAERTVMSAPCPVLVVPDGAAPFNGWADLEQRLRLVVGLDLDAAGHAVLDQVRQLREAGPVDATFVHTYWPPQEYARLGLQGRRDIFGDDQEVIAVLEREIRARLELPAGPGKNALRIRGGWGRVGDTLAQESVSERADLLVVGTRQPHGWDWVRGGSEALGTLRAAGTSVLCIPAAHRPAADATLDPTPAIPVLRSVLAPTDFSDLGNAAIAHAYSLVRSAGGVVELCHVHERHLPVPIHAYEAKEGALTAEQRAQIEARLRSLIPWDADRIGITTRISVIDGGSAAEALVQAARRLGVDAIALGSHGRSGLGRTLLGSVAEGVVRQFERPVLVVRAARR
jgi:nucleotide-binding universal stress UspA family protein